MPIFESMRCFIVFVVQTKAARPRLRRLVIGAFLILCICHAVIIGAHLLGFRGIAIDYKDRTLRFEGIYHVGFHRLSRVYS
jgi:hypothetical protein